MSKLEELTNEARADQACLKSAEQGGRTPLGELIQQYCPDGVEYVKLKDVCIKVCSGGTPSRGNGDYFTGNIPWLRTQEVDFKDIYDTEIKITEEAVKNSSAKIIPENCVIIAMYGATAGKVGINKIPLTTNQACCNLQIDPQKALYKYVYFWVCNEYENIKALGQGSQNNINAQVVKDYPIPVPPLPVQEEIVRILDTFTELQAELQAELQKRLQQYNYYRDYLLANFSPDKEVKECTLGEIGTFTRGNGLQKKDFTETGVGCIHYGQIYTRFGAFTDKTLTYVDEELASHLLQVEKGNLVIACTSENVEDICKCVAWLGDENICTGGHACVFRHQQNPKYISYFFQTECFFNQKVKYTYGTKVKDIKPDSIAKIRIPLPSLAEQDRIVSILDNLYTLTNDLSQGLPAEIEKRKQQYEYYRDRLLTFKRKDA